MSEPTQYRSEAHSKDNDIKGPADACIFVASLSSQTDEDKLAGHFRQFGTILKVKLLSDKKTGRPYAFVQFKDKDASERAIAEVPRHIIDGRQLRVEKAKVNRTLFVAKLSKDMSNSELRRVAETFGVVENVAIIKNHQTNKSKGCGFVKYRFREDASEALVGLKQKNRRWVVEWATSANDPDTLGIDKHHVFVGGLNPSVSKETLMARFKKHGEIESCTLINPNNSDSKGAETTQERSAFAFIRYEDESFSATAIENENGTRWQDRRIRVQYCETPEMKYRKRFNKYMNYIAQYSGPYYYSMMMQNPYFYPGVYYTNNNGAYPNGYSPNGYAGPAGPAGPNATPTNNPGSPENSYKGTPYNPYTAQQQKAMSQQYQSYPTAYDYYGQQQQFQNPYTAAAYRANAYYMANGQMPQGQMTAQQHPDDGETENASEAKSSTPEYDPAQDLPDQMENMNINGTGNEKSGEASKT